jgi:hypothetical protein
MTTPAGSQMPDYFALFQSMLNPATSAAAPSMFAMLDPKEIDKKISELETVLTWLKGTVGVVELSLQTLKYQQSVLATMAEAGKGVAKEAGTVEKSAAPNPAMWAWDMLQKAGAANVAAAEQATKKTSARKKR